MPSDTEDCEVEEILDERMKNDKRELLLKWRGFSAKHNLWVPEENLSCDELKQKFEIGQFKKIVAVRRNNNVVDYLVDLQKRSSQVFSSTDMRKKWPEETIKYLEKIIEYIPSNVEFADDNRTNEQMTNNSIGEPIRILYVAKIGKKTMYFIKFAHSNKFLTTENARVLCPDLVLSYLESKLQAVA